MYVAKFNTKDQQKKEKKRSRFVFVAGIRFFIFFFGGGYAAVVSWDFESALFNFVSAK